MTQAFSPTAAKTDPMSRLETVFSSVLDEIWQANSNGRALRHCVGKLAAALGNDKLDAFRDQKRRLQKGVADVSGEVGETKTFVDGVSHNSRRMAHHLKELGENIQSANIVALNARIIAQGHRHLERGAHMVRLSENISEITDRASSEVAEMFQVMDRTSAAIAVITAGADRRARESALTVLPKLKDLSELLVAMEHAMELAQTTADWMTGFVSSVDDDASRIIIALQAGDRAQQRMQHVHMIRNEAISYPMSSPEGQALRALAVRQEAETALQANEDVKQAAAKLNGFVSKIEKLQSHSALLTRTFHTGGLRDFLRSDIGDVPMSIPPGEKSRTAMAELKSCDGLLRDHSNELNVAAFQMQLASINTIIACARMGQQAADMIVISQQINEVISAVPEIFGRFSAALDETRALLVATGIRGDGDLPQAELLDMTTLEEARSAIASALPEVMAFSDEIVTSILKANGTLATFAAELGVLQTATEKALRSTVPENFRPDAAFQAVLDKLRASYSMEDERRLHDQLFGTPKQMAEANKPKPKPAPQDDLSDILF